MEEQKNKNAHGDENVKEVLDEIFSEAKTSSVPPDERPSKYGIPNYEQLFMDGTEGGSGGVLKLLLKQNWHRLVISALLNIIKFLPAWAIPLITADVINILTSGEDDVFWSIAIRMIILVVLIVQNVPSTIVHSKYTMKFLRTIGSGLRATLVRKLQHLSIAYHTQIESGRIQSKFLRDIESIELLNNHMALSVIPTITTLLVSIGIAIYRSGWVSLFFVLIVPANVFLIRFFRKPLNTSSRDFRKANENISAKVTNMITMIPVTKAHGLESEEISALDYQINLLREKGLMLDKANAYFGSLLWVSSQLMSLVCLAFTSIMAYYGYIDLGDIVLFQSLFSTISSSIQALINVYPEIVKGTEAVKSVSEVILSKDIEDNKNKIRLRYVHGTVVFNNVSYRYPSSKEDVIKDFSLTVEPGQCIAFVGSSGSGKSTIMNMIIGFLPPTSGELYIDGKPIEALSLTDYRHFISVVPQAGVLFPGTIRENITYGLSDISEDRLNEIVHLANIDEFLKDFPDGLDTVVGERGATLSGGQRQRISIARALIRDPKILILDEATSALDNISEYHVQKAINNLTKGRTTFIVAHRLSTIRDADKIVVMDHGKCVEFGTFEELMALKGKFYELKNLSELNAGN